MNTEAHWIQTGFEIPEDQFSFTVVFFESQLEILGRLESELSSVCERLDHNQIHLGSNVVQKEIKTLLELIKIRAEQLADVLDNDLQHELGITIDMALRSLMNNLEAVRSRSIKLQIGSLLQPTNRQEQSSEFRAELYAVLLSLGEVLKFSRQLHTRAEKEWSSVVRDE